MPRSSVASVTKGLEKIEQNLLGFRFPLSWHTFQQMRTTGKSIYIADTDQRHQVAKYSGFGMGAFLYRGSFGHQR